MTDTITLSCGFGGKASRELIEEIIFPIFNDNIHNGNDAALLNIGNKNIAVSTDSFVISPIFFPGGNIGKLAVAGSVNDVLTRGAMPKFLTCSFIIEEGFLTSDFIEILKSIKDEADKNGCTIVTGDTKVLRRGECDGVFINTTAIGIIDHNLNIEPKQISNGDKIILTGTIGDHEAAITLARENLPFDCDIVSDCGGLRSIIEPLIDSHINIKTMRDPTRGGLAATLNELILDSGLGMNIWEDCLPINDTVRYFCQITGIDPLSLANEGKMIIIVAPADEVKTLEILKELPLGKSASTIGTVTADKNYLVLETIVSKRIIPMPSFAQLPRIC